MRLRRELPPALRPLPPPIMVSARPAAGEPPIRLRSVMRRRRRGRLTPRRATRTAQPRLPKFRSRARSICVPKWREPSVRERATAAAEDALSTAKSLFHAVLPK